MHEVGQGSVSRRESLGGMNLKSSSSYGCVFAEPSAAWNCILAQAQAFQPASGAAASRGRLGSPGVLFQCSTLLRYYLAYMYLTCTCMCAQAKSPKMGGQAARRQRVMYIHVL